MTEINFLPEVLVEKQIQAQRGKQGFYIGFALLALTLTSTFAIQVYKDNLQSQAASLETEIAKEKSTIQSLKNTEGLYRSLKIKSRQLTEIFKKHQDYPLLITGIKGVASASNVTLQRYSVGNDQKLELTAVANSYGDLVSFLQLLDYQKGILDSVKQNEEKGYIEFKLTVSM